jgi:hypothetical protein
LGTDEHRIRLSTSVHPACNIWGLYSLTISHNFDLPEGITALPIGFSIAAGTGSAYIPMLCWAISTYSLVGTIVFESPIPMTTFNDQLRCAFDLSWLAYSIFGSTAVVDVVIAATLCYYLKNGARIGIRVFAILPAW